MSFDEKILSQDIDEVNVPKELIIEKILILLIGNTTCAFGDSPIIIPTDVLVENNESE